MAQIEQDAEHIMDHDSITWLLPIGFSFMMQIFVFHNMPEVISGDWSSVEYSEHIVMLRKPVWDVSFVTCLPAGNSHEKMDALWSWTLSVTVVRQAVAFKWYSVGI